MPLDYCAEFAPVTGDVAHDAVDSGNPQKIGAVAIAYGTTPAVVATGDRTNLYADRAGIPFAITGHPDAQTFRATYTTAQTDAALFTVATGFKVIVTRYEFALAKATTAASVAFLAGFGLTTTPAAAGVFAAHPGIDPGGGHSQGNGGGILAAGADGEEIRVTCDAPTGGRLDFVVSYHLIAV